MPLSSTAEITCDPSDGRKRRRLGVEVVHLQQRGFQLPRTARVAGARSMVQPLRAGKVGRFSALATLRLADLKTRLATPARP